MNRLTLFVSGLPTDTKLQFLLDFYPILEKFPDISQTFSNASVQHNTSRFRLFFRLVDMLMSFKYKTKERIVRHVPCLA